MMVRLLALLVLSAAPSFAWTAAVAGDAVQAARTIRPGEVIAAADLTLGPSDTAGALAALEDAIGMTARRLLVSGRPVMPADVGPPALVRRNSQVSLIFERGALSIRADGRALSDGAVGQEVRVMNLASRQTVTGIVRADGSVATGG
jgi:flagella basal body P-ring formation protein FlgA